MEKYNMESIETIDTPKQKVEWIIKKLEEHKKKLEPRCAENTKNSLWSCHYKEKESIKRFINENKQALQEARDTYIWSLALHPDDHDTWLLTRIEETMIDRTIINIFDVVDNQENPQYTTIRNANLLQKYLDSDWVTGEIEIDITRLKDANWAQPARIDNDILDWISKINCTISSDQNWIAYKFKKTYQDNRTDTSQYKYSTSDGKFMVKNNKWWSKSTLDQWTVNYLEERTQQCKIMRNNWRWVHENNPTQDQNDSRLETEVSKMW